jgi:hypothetical protein
LIRSNFPGLEEGRSVLVVKGAFEKLGFSSGKILDEGT